MKEQFKDSVWTPDQNELQKEREWILNQIQEIGEKNLTRLARKAAHVAENAYQPYSNYSVGAALLTVNGAVFASCNGEVVSYSETDHAETGAISKAISAGMVKKEGRAFIKAMAVVHSGESGPCGRCRQRILEHADNCLVIDVYPDGRIKKITSLTTLLPYAFGPKHLGK